MNVAVCKDVDSQAEAAGSRGSPPRWLNHLDESSYTLLSCDSRMIRMACPSLSHGFSSSIGADVLEQEPAKVRSFQVLPEHQEPLCWHYHYV